MAKELRCRDDVFGCLVVLSRRRGSEVVAFDGEPMRLVELSEHLRPLVSRDFPVPTREHDLGVRCTNGVLVSFDGIDCLLIKHDSTSSTLLSCDIQVAVTILIGFKLCDRAKRQADSILDT